MSHDWHHPIYDELVRETLQADLDRAVPPRRQRLADALPLLLAAILFTALIVWLAIQL